jgi:hypothetical protein
MQYVEIEKDEGVLTVSLAERANGEGFNLAVMRVVPGGERHGFDPEMENYEVGAGDRFFRGGVQSWSLDGHRLALTLTSEAAEFVGIGSEHALGHRGAGPFGQWGARYYADLVASGGLRAAIQATAIAGDYDVPALTPLTPCGTRCARTQFSRATAHCWTPHTSIQYSARSFPT